MRAWFLGTAIVAFCLAPAAADERDDFIGGIGDVLAAEAFCELHYDQAALADLIEGHIEPTDMEFTRDLKGAVWVADLQQQKMGAALKVAHCTQVTRLASTLGLTVQ